MAAPWQQRAPLPLPPQPQHLPACTRQLQLLGGGQSGEGRGQQVSLEQLQKSKRQRRCAAVSAARPSERTYRQPQPGRRGRLGGDVAHLGFRAASASLAKLVKRFRDLVELVGIHTQAGVFEIICMIGPFQRNAQPPDRSGSTAHGSCSEGRHVALSVTLAARTGVSSCSGFAKKRARQLKKNKKRL